MTEPCVIKLYNNDNIKVLRDMPDSSVGSFVTDSPYGLKFMGKKWDYEIPSVETWKECLRVLKPGGHLAAFCGTRTQHRMVVNIEDAGFEIRDVICWLNGQGLPKSYNIANGIEGIIRTGSANWSDWKELGGEEYTQKTGYVKKQAEQGYRKDYSDRKSRKVILTTEEAKKWEGWGTALKPACEFITLARKPISEKNVALNVLKWGVGGLNIGDCLIELNGEIVPINILESWSGFGQLKKPKYTPTQNTKGRWPANLVLDEEAGKLLDEQAKGVSRFFFCSKPTKKEKNFGLENLPDKEVYRYGAGLGEGHHPEAPAVEKNNHPTVKPIELMKYIIKLVTPFNEICVDPFMGSGSTIIACKLLNISAIGIERDPGYFSIAESRIKAWEIPEE